MIIQKTLRGRGCLRKLPELTEKLGMKTPMIVGGEMLACKVRKALNNPDIPTFSAYHANPDLNDCEAGADLFIRKRCDGLISVGGGSAIDTAKTIKARLAASSMEEVRNNRFSAESKTVHIAIPGTAGSGAEVTDTAVVYDDGNKLSLSGKVLLPEGVVLDAELLATLPEYHRKSAALDALAQGIESYWSRAATEDSRVHAYLAILGVLDNLKAYLAGDPHAEEEMLDAAHQGGKAIRITRTTAAHAMSYRLTKTFGIAHGHACILTLPVLWEMMIGNKDTEPVLRDLSAKMRLGDAHMAPKLLRGILYDMKLETPAMPDEETLKTLAASVNPERLGNHPAHLTEAELLSVYRKAFTPLCDAERQACLDIWTYYGR